MKSITHALSIALVSLAILTGCGGTGEGAFCLLTCGRPPPSADQSLPGQWNGHAMTPGAPDASTVSTSFEFNATGGFEIGTTPLRAFFSSGNAETRGVPSFYISGINAWHVLVGTSATVTFETPPRTLSFWVRTENAADVSTIQILDGTSTLITTVTPTDAYQKIVVCRTAAETPIESMVVISTSGGDVVIDDLSFGFPCTTDDIFCLIAETLELGCEVDVESTNDLVAGVQGTVQVNGSQVTGTGTLYAAPGTTLADGSAFANLTISGTVSERDSLNLTITAAGVSISVSSTFVASVYDRGSALATVAGNYPTFDIFGDPASFSVDASGAITSGSNSGCVGNGQISIINANFNAYDVTLNVTSCGALDGMYNGLGLTLDRNATDDNFTFGVYTSQAVIIGHAIK